MRDLRDYSLKAHNTFGIDARCNRFLEYTSQEEARQVARILRSEQQPYIIIGGGSNLLLTRDYPGIVVHSACTGIEWLPQGEAVCGSGVAWDDVVVQSLQHRLYGAENLSLIPGDVGASAVQNIGAYGAEVCELVSAVECVEIATGQTCTISAADCQYGYRQSRFKTEWAGRYLITSVRYRFSTVYQPRLDYGNIRTALAGRGISQPTAEQLREVIIDIRRQKLPDPAVEGNAGSFFMNPVVSREKFQELSELYPQMPHYRVDEGHEKIPAGWLIDQCGWKGRTLGRAGVHAQQALVLVNRGGATGQDIVALSDAIRRDVSQRFGIEIRPEVNII